MDGVVAKQVTLTLPPEYKEKVARCKQGVIPLRRVLVTYSVSETGLSM